MEPLHPTGVVSAGLRLVGLALMVLAAQVTHRKLISGSSTQEPPAALLRSALRTGDGQEIPRGASADATSQAGAGAGVKARSGFSGRSARPLRPACRPLLSVVPGTLYRALSSAYSSRPLLTLLTLRWSVCSSGQGCVCFVVSPVCLCRGAGGRAVADCTAGSRPVVSRVRHRVESAAFCVGLQLQRRFADPGGQPRVPGQAPRGATRNKETAGGSRYLVHAVRQYFS